MAYVIVDGVVDRTYFEGKGVTFHEEFKKRDGETGKAYFSAFFDSPHGLSEGDKGTFKGNLSVRLREYEVEGQTKYSADATLNNAKYEAASGDEPF